MQAIIWALKHPKEYERIEELIAHYHTALTNANAEMAKDYPLEMATENSRCYMACMVASYSGVSVKMMNFALNTRNFVLKTRNFVFK